MVTVVVASLLRFQTTYHAFPVSLMDVIVKGAGPYSLGQEPQLAVAVAGCVLTSAFVLLARRATSASRWRIPAAVLGLGLGMWAWQLVPPVVMESFSPYRGDTWIPGPGEPATFFLAVASGMTMVAAVLLAVTDLSRAARPPRTSPTPSTAEAAPPSSPSPAGDRGDFRRAG